MEETMVELDKAELLPDETIDEEMCVRALLFEEDRELDCALVVVTLEDKEEYWKLLDTIVVGKEDNEVEIVIGVVKLEEVE